MAATGNTSVNSMSSFSQLDGANDALDSNLPENGSSSNSISNENINPLDLSQKDALSNTWYDVAITNSPNFLVTEYLIGNNNSEVLNHKNIQLSSIKKQLEPGMSYKFRVAAINSCGRGPWSEATVFSTCIPGFPGAPCSIKIVKGNNAIHVSWEPPQNSCGQIKEYSVYMSVKLNRPQQEEPNAPKKPPSFVQIYCGEESNCSISSETLGRASIDYSSKPAILLRIAAKNEKGYGPATQVRWLQGLKT